MSLTSNNENIPQYPNPTIEERTIDGINQLYIKYGQFEHYVNKATSPSNTNINQKIGQ
jgi:hypothetical protein